MICLVPNCQHPQSRDNLCRWHRHQAQFWRDDPELGLVRFCMACDEWLPAEPAPDAEGNPVRFWIIGTWVRCYACTLTENTERMRRRVAA